MHPVNRFILQPKGKKHLQTTGKKGVGFIIKAAKSNLTQASGTMDGDDHYLDYYDRLTAQMGRNGEVVTRLQWLIVVWRKN
jgi:hypothetical protein